MRRNLLVIACLFGLFAVILGAFGAHSLDGKISEKLIRSFETGVRYQFYHTFGIFLVVILSRIYNNPLFLRAAWCFIAGTLLFSGSIYLLSCRELLGIDHWKSFLGPITPLGGLFFMVGWALLLFTILKTDKDV